MLFRSLFVTNDMGAVERYCDRAMLIEKGEVVRIGDPHEIGQEYLRTNFEVAAREAAQRLGGSLEAQPGRWGDGTAEVLGCWFEGAARDTAVVEHGKPATFSAEVEFHADAVDPVFGVELHNSRSELVMHASSHQTGERTGTFKAGDRAIVRITFDNVLAADQYVATPSVAHRGQGQNWMDRREGLIAFTVASTLGKTNASVELPFDLAVERSAATETAPA